VISGCSTPANLTSSDVQRLSPELKDIATSPFSSTPSIPEVQEWHDQLASSNESGFHTNPDTDSNPENSEPNDTAKPKSEF